MDNNNVGQSHLWVVFCIPGSQSDGLQVQFTAQINSRYYVSNSREKQRSKKTLIKKENIQENYSASSSKSNLRSNVKDLVCVCVYLQKNFRKR